MKNITYYAICGTQLSSGVYRKVLNFVNSAKRNNFTARPFVIQPGIFSHFKLAYALAKSESDVAVIRSNSYGLFLLQFGILVAKIRGVKIVIDIPTPLHVTLVEQWSSDDYRYIKIVKIIGLLISGPWCLWLVDRVIQYAPESAWFSLGLRSKTLMIGNGIDVQSISMRTQYPNWPAKQIILLGVGGLSIWHGYDIVIKSLYECKRNTAGRSNIVFNIVGSGDELENLKALVNKLSLNDCVYFYGSLFGSDLNAHYQSAHFGVGSFGLHRIGLKMASPLKLREYAAVGLPFIYATDDPDFQGDLKFCHKFVSSEDHSTLTKFLEVISNIEYISNPMDIRDYALAKLDYQSKVSQVLSFLDE